MENEVVIGIVKKDEKVLMVKCDRIRAKLFLKRNGVGSFFAKSLTYM